MEDLNAVSQCSIFMTRALEIKQNFVMNIFHLFWTCYTEIFGGVRGYYLTVMIFFGQNVTFLILPI